MFLPAGGGVTVLFRAHQRTALCLGQQFLPRHKEISISQLLIKLRF